MNALLHIPDPYATARHRMVEKQLRARGIADERVLAAMERVSRHEFLPPSNRHLAYDDHPVPIGEGQTISQPYMVASMLEAARIQPADIALEIGTGSGYQTALLAELAAEVFSIERHAALAAAAQRILAHLQYANVVLMVGDGSLGLPEAAPYNVILVSAAAPAVPPALVEQLSESGRLVLPIGSENDQMLHLVRRSHGMSVDQPLFGCKFVPLIGKQGFPSGA